MAWNAILVMLVFGGLLMKGNCSLSACPENDVFPTGGYNVDLSILKGLWQTVSIEGTDIHSSDITVPRFFNISLFSTLQTSCNGDHVCYTEDFSSFYSLGKHESCMYQVEERIISIVYQFSDDAELRFGSGNVTITLVCGLILGVPEVIEGDPHNHAVEIIWITSAACKPSSDDTSTHNETKCYLLNHSEDKENGIQAEFIDLSGLIQNRGYETTMAERPNIILNVSICRPMRGGDCDGSMICLYQSDSHLNVDLSGKHLKLATLPTSGSHNDIVPHYEDGIVTVIYPITAKAVPCKDDSKSPFAKIKFYCPVGDEVLGPYIEFIDNDLCVILIKWYTMHACDIRTIQSSDCTLTTPYGFSFDLRGLNEQSVVDNQYSYYIHPCGPGITDCHTSPKEIHVSQIENTTNTCYSLGAGDGKLRYVDGTLTLTYGLGDTCHGSGYARASIITFICPKNIISGNSDCNETAHCVTFAVEDNCLYQFEWITELACIPESESSCEFELNHINYNLGLLTEGYKPTYAAIATANDTECYLISPCGNIEVTDESKTASEYCNMRMAPEEFCTDTSVCRIKKTGSPIAESLGYFNLEDSKMLNAVDNNVISVATKPSSNHKQALIQYICKTGTLLTSPIFISQFTSNITEFHWYTFAACPQGVSIGSDCLVTEPTTGFTFNLTSLSDKTFQFIDTINKYNYSIRVCSEIPRDTLKESCAENTAVCQHDNNDHYNSAGKPNSTLIYADSSLKLSYLEGTSCSTGVRQSTVVFLCDPDTHTAVVQNVTEIEHCSYLIEMKTRFACPPAYRSLECVYFAPSGDTYDLNELERTEGNWQAEGADGSVYLINICRPLNLQGIGGCNPLSAVCRTGGGVPHQDLGHASTASFGPPPKSSSNITMVLNYTYNHNDDNGCPVVYTNIQFVCNRTTSVNSGPRHLSGGDISNPCEYVFIWETRIVCPVKEIIVKKSCNVTDPGTGYTFNLDPLKTHNNNIYKVNGGDANFTLTICDVLPDSKSPCVNESHYKISVCQTDSTNHSHSSGNYSSMELVYIENSLSLTYKGGDSCSVGSRITEIDFICDRFATDNYFGEPSFVSESSHCHYLFEWPTALACPPTTLTCTAGGGKYDLRPLLATRNWHISSSDGREYVIGGCQSIDADAIPECSFSVGVGACLYTPNSGSPGDILGYVTGDIVVINDGHLQLSYHNGKLCPDIGLRSVVEIHFYCNKDIDGGEPVLQSHDSSGCKTEIRWETKYACSQDNSSSSWVITNPSTGQTFDLRKLKPILWTQYEGYNYSIGLAGHTVECGDTKNVTVCQKSLSSDATYIIAKIPSNGKLLELVGGKIQLTTQNGDQCHHHPIKRKSTIYFEYDPRDDYLVVLAEKSCEYSFVVYTKLVYQEKQDLGIECYVQNFPSLEWFTSFETPPLSIGNGKIYFSVCQPISADNQDATDGFEGCSDVTGACYVEGNEAINLGRPSSHHPPEIISGGNGVLISYVGGDTCKDSTTYTTKIILECSNYTSGIPHISFFNLTASCEVTILWSSEHACPLPIPTSEVSDSVCSIRDPFDGATISLSTLSNDSHVMSVGGDYIIGLCGPISKAPEHCKDNHAGVCHHRDNQWMKMSDANHSLTIVSHSPHAIDVQYSSGESCDSQMTWTVNVHMYCSNHNNSDRPYLESTSGCDIRFTWPTSALCLTEVEGCFVTNTDGTIQDLEPLVSQTWNGAYLDDSEHLGFFNLSVCRNLNPTASEGINCFPGPAGICLLPDTTNDQYKNLGYMSSPPKLNKDGTIILEYKNGGSCGTDGNNITTTAYLKCPDTESEARPQLQNDPDNDCHYIINWNTKVACKQKTEESESCVVEDPQAGIQYNFNPLAKKMSFPNDSSPLYNICLCPGGSCGDDTYIYKINVTNSNKKIKLGKFHQMIVYPNSGPQVDFYRGDKCPGHNNYSSTILMMCDRGISDEKGIFVYEEALSTAECKKFFSWWTPVACNTPEISCTIENPFYDFTPLYPIDGFWETSGSHSREKYLINICGAIQSNTTECSGDAAVCLKKSDGSYRDIGFANTQRITINSNGNPQIHFTGPKECSIRSSVIIEMICGVKGLKFISNDTCTYRFDWYTTFACKESNSLHTQKTCETYVEENNPYTFIPEKLKGVQHVLSRDGGTYHVNLCEDARDDCPDGVQVCYTDGSSSKPLVLGDHNKATITIDSYWMQFSMSGDDGTSVITVECATTEIDDQEHSDIDLEKIFFENEFITSDKKRTAYFRMYTSKGCQFDKDKVPTGTTAPTSSQPTSSSHQSTSNKKATIAGVVIILVLAVIVAMVMVIVLRNKNRREYLSRKFYSLISNKANEPVRYVRAKKTEAEASLLEDSDSSDEEFSKRGDNTKDLKLKRRDKKKVEPLLVDLKDEEVQEEQEEEEHHSDEELLNI